LYLSNFLGEDFANLTDFVGLLEQKRPPVVKEKEVEDFPGLLATGGRRRLI